MESAGLLEIGLKVIFSAENNLFNTKVIVHLPNALSESIIRCYLLPLQICFAYIPIYYP